MKFDYELVGKIGSMALIRKADNDIDYNIFSRLGAELKPGMIWVSSGATEIGRLDYVRRNGKELTGDVEEVKADYSSQGQTILMMEYRRYIPDRYGVRQLLVEHTHFNDEEKRKHIRAFLLRCAKQNAIPIVNYNDPVSIEEVRKMELAHLREQAENVVECIDNDETASVICSLVHAKYLVILTSADGIYRDPNDPNTLVPARGRQRRGRNSAADRRTFVQLRRGKPRGRKRRQSQAGLHQAAHPRRHDCLYCQRAAAHLRFAQRYRPLYRISRTLTKEAQ